jgi:predicted site-specific integrase-resolvase
MTPYTPEADLAGGMRLNKWCKLVGISKMTCWRLRKAGKLKTVTRYGIVFITAAEIKRWFEDCPDDELRVRA